MTPKAQPKSDIEIARAADMAPIEAIGERLGIPAPSLYRYGPYKAKVSYDFIDSLKDRPDGKLVLVTAITPTPAGEGKTTTSHPGCWAGPSLNSPRHAPGEIQRPIVSCAASPIRKSALP